MLVCKSFTLITKRWSDLKQPIHDRDLCDYCEVQASYAIGVSKPLSIYLKLGEKDQDKTIEVEKIIKDNFFVTPNSYCGLF